MGELLSLRVVNGALIALTFLSLGFLVGQSDNSTYISSSQETLEVYPLDISNAGIHRHEEQFVDSNEPSVNLKVHRDEMMYSHFNLEISTENFEFAPENVSDRHIPNYGHAHVYVDDVMISRSYGKWYHLPRLEPGNHTIKVTLNTNNHKEYTNDKGVIKDEVKVEVDKKNIKK